MRAAFPTAARFRTISEPVQGARPAKAQHPVTKIVDEHAPAAFHLLMSTISTSQDHRKGPGHPLQPPPVGGKPATAPNIVHETLASSGQPLDQSTKSFMQSRFDRSFDDVRVHTDERASRSARAVGALAYTVGRQIAFDHRYYHPHERSGRRLLAHELAHVVQQHNLALGGRPKQLAIAPAHSAAEREANDTAGRIVGLPASRNGPERETKPGAGPRALDTQSSSSSLHLALQRQTGTRQAPEWDPFYGNLKIGNESYESFKAKIPGLTPSSSARGTPKKDMNVTIDQLYAIYPQLRRDALGDERRKQQPQLGVKEASEYYLDKLNEAFRLMKIDTVEAQASYLAHAVRESGQFSKFTQSTSDRQRYLTYRFAVEADLYKDHPVPEKMGRGPVQVTGPQNYLKALAYLERQADFYRDMNPPEIVRELLCRQAVEDIKADHRNAAHPRYTFLFSAAFMKVLRGDTTVTVGASPGMPLNFLWVRGGSFESQEAIDEKQNAYSRALKVLAGT